MNEHGKSDRRVVPTKPPNNGHERPAEGVEGRRLAKGNPHQQTMFRTQRRVRMSHELERVRQVASRDRKMRFTALLHHVYRLDTLRRAYLGLKRAGSPWCRWRDVAAVRRTTGGQPPGACRTAEARGRTERSLPGGATSRKPMGGRDLWASPRWKTKSSRPPSSRSSMPSMRWTSLVSRTGAALGVARMTRWMRSRWDRTK